LGQEFTNFFSGQQQIAGGKLQSWLGSQQMSWLGCFEKSQERWMWHFCGISRVVCVPRFVPAHFYGTKKHGGLGG